MADSKLVKKILFVSALAGAAILGIGGCAPKYYVPAYEPNKYNNDTAYFNHNPIIISRDGEILDPKKEYKSINK